MLAGAKGLARHARDNDQVSGRKPIWQRSRAWLVASVVVFVSLIILALVGVPLFWPGPASGTLVSFVCKSSSGRQAFVIQAGINLTDGMDQEEAVEVASEVFQSVYLKPGENWKQEGLYTNVNSDENGTWTVDYIGIYSLPIPGHMDGRAENNVGAAFVRKSMILIINPSDQTVEYIT